MNDKQKVIILGSGGHARSCIDVALRRNEINVIGILDNEKKIGNKIAGIEVLGTDERILEYAKRETKFIIGVGQIKTSNNRIALFEKIVGSGGKMQNLIAVSASISSNAILGNGVTIMEGARIGPGVFIGDGVIVNTNAIIEHDSTIKDFCHISTGAIVNGGCEIGQNTFVGSGTVIMQQIKIGRKCTIGMLQKINFSVNDETIIK